MLSTNNNEFVNFGNLSPNPSSGIFAINNRNSDFSTADVEIYNSLGALVKTTSSKRDNLEIDITGQPKGIYFVKITVNGKTQTQKVVVE